MPRVPIAPQRAQAPRPKVEGRLQVGTLPSALSSSRSLSDQRLAASPEPHERPDALRCAQMRSAAVAAGAGCQTKVQTPWPTAPATGARDDADRHNPTRPIFSNSPADAEVSLFFYAGHGLQVAGQNYLVSIDAKAETADTLDREMVCLALVQRTMERAASSNIKVLTPVAITLGAAIWLASWVRVCSRSTAAWQPWTLASAR